MIRTLIIRRSGPAACTARSARFVIMWIRFLSLFAHDSVMLVPLSDGDSVVWWIGQAARWHLLPWQDQFADALRYRPLYSVLFANCHACCCAGYSLLVCVGSIHMAYGCLTVGESWERCFQALVLQYMKPKRMLTAPTCHCALVR